MVKKIIMPRLDIDMEKGIIIEWMKKEGEKIEIGETIAVVMSEKVTYEVESPASGILYKIIAEKDSEVPVGKTIAIIKEEGDTEEELEREVQEAFKSLKEIEALIEVKIKREERKKSIKKEVKPKRIKISPIARRLALEYGLDITKIKGTGPGGRIVKADILRVISTMKTSKIADKIRLSGVRRITAERMTESARIPQASLTVSVDMSRMIKLRDEMKKSVKNLPFDAIFIKVVAEALKEHRIMNSTLDESEIKIFSDINIGFAVATDEGLLVPVVKNADVKSLFEIAEEVNILIEKAKNRKLTAEELKSGTFTITNLGVLGIEEFKAIINPPQAGILAIGKIMNMPVAEERVITIKPVVKLTLSFDHRVVDGAPAAKFLMKIKELLENPSWIKN